MTDEVIGGVYAVTKRVGKGSFGDIFAGKDTKTGHLVALKFSSKEDKSLQLLKECKVYRALNGALGFSPVHYFGEHNGANVLVLDLLSVSLEDHLSTRGRPFTLKTILMVADQALARLEFLHRKGFVHRDVKPANFVFGRKSGESVLHLIDFGLAVPYRDQRTWELIPYNENQCIAGTARYASINSHLGIVAAPRDDLESLAYTLIYLAKMHLPWQGVQRSAKYEAIAKIKMQTPIDEVCAGIPKEFAIFLDQVRSLRYEDTPDYAFFRKLFRQLFVREGFLFDCVYDWTDN